MHTPQVMKRCAQQITRAPYAAPRPVCLVPGYALLGMALCLVGLLGLTTPATRAGEESLPSGDEIARRINARDEGRTVSRLVVMELTDRHGKQLVQETRTFRKYFGAERRTAIFYVNPPNVKGTAFLTYDYAEADREDVQWLYLPALRKTRRIAAADRGDYFLGTDFTYEDIKLETQVNLADYTRKTMRIDTIDGHHCYVVEAIPVHDKVAQELGYGRVLQWVDAALWMPRKAEFWDVRGVPLKTITFQDIRQVQGIWTAHRIEAQHHKTGHRTVFTFSDVEYEKEVDNDLFTEHALRRGL